jgi:hypothetical protein
MLRILSSKDGTSIASDLSGQGPALILGDTQRGNPSSLKKWATVTAYAWNMW